MRARDLNSLASIFRFVYTSRSQVIRISRWIFSWRRCLPSQQPLLTFLQLMRLSEKVASLGKSREGFVSSAGCTVNHCTSSTLNTGLIFPWLQLQTLLVASINATAWRPIQLTLRRCSILSVSIHLGLRPVHAISALQLLWGQAGQHSPLKKSHYIADEFKDFQRWKACQADVAAVSDWLSNERKTKGLLTLQENYYRAKCCLHSAC